MQNTTPSRKTLRWSVAVAVAAAAGALTVLVDADRADTSLDDIVGLAPADKPTELDIHGIPTWWSGEPAAPRRNDATELDIHGIPTWWSGEPAAPVHRSARS